MKNDGLRIDLLRRAGRQPPLGLGLLRFAASEPAPEASGPPQTGLLQTTSEREFQWLLQAGWGPLMYRATRDHIAELPTARRDVLLSEELTAQVTCAALADTTNEVIDTCRRLQADVTLLKGVSVADQYYPAPHLRAMSDIDALIDPQAYASVEAALLARGYRPDPGWAPTQAMHHGAPLQHPERRVWVELHTRLFPEGDTLNRGLVFSPAGVAANSVASSFHGRPIRRLSHELQLIYAASSWMRDMSRSGIHPSFLNSLLDIVQLLRVAGDRLDWDDLFRQLDNEMVTAYVYVALAYVDRRGLGAIAPEVLAQLAAGQKLVGAVQMRLTHAMLDRHLLGGRPWTHALPPPVPPRWGLRFQLNKRFGLRWPG